MTLDELFEVAPFSLPKAQKAAVLTAQLKALTGHHVQHCESYKQILVAMGLKVEDIQTLEDIPFLPTRLFKSMELRSVASQDIVKTMTSSGTSGQAVSRIFLDRDTSALQTKVLTRIVSDFVGKQRLPLVILDTSEVVKNRQLFSARGAGILGFSMFGSKKLYAFNEHMEIDVEAMSVFLAEHAGKSIMLFGFTFMVWLHFVQALERSGFRPDLSEAILIHGGGFKKLTDQAVSKAEFKARLNKVCGISPKNVHDYYGMVEQTGTIYVECPQGNLHTSNFSDVIIRRAEDFSVASIGEKGIIQVLSVLPRSYPGHSLLTEDEGVCLGEDDCLCGRFGKYFRIEGRLQRAEIRGCSDTYASSV